MKLALFVSCVVLMAFFVESASHKRKHLDKSVKHEHVDAPEGGLDVRTAWPSPATVSDFDVPDAFTEPPGSGDGSGSHDENAYSGKAHKRSGRKSHSD